MHSRWNEKESQQFKTDLELRVYTSQLLGRDPTLVLHGGGNTSVKITEKNILGKDEELLYVKGSGWDLEFIDTPGFAPVRLKHLLELAKLDALSDPEMVNELKTHMTNASAPTPSVEAILHATLPFKYVDHTHANAIVTITNTKDGRQRIEEIFGDTVVIIDYIMPGFDLAKQCAKQFAAEATEKTQGMILMNHGIFTFGPTARVAYEMMISLVNKAEIYLQQQNAWDCTQVIQKDKPLLVSNVIPALRKTISTSAGLPMILRHSENAKCRTFAANQKVAEISQHGPATPDHVIRTKQLPMIGTDVDAYAVNYQKYFATNSATAKDKKSILDSAPRVILDPSLGMLSVGKTPKDARIVEDIYAHTIDIIQRAEKLGGYTALPDQDIFDMEYWDLEQAKLQKKGATPVFQGEVALVTGAASGIGQACVASLLTRGAAVVALDTNPDVTSALNTPNYLGLICDVTSTTEVKQCLEQAVASFGGLDILVLNAGMFPGGAKIAELENDLWRKVMRVNVDANQFILKSAFNILQHAPNGGRVIIMASKNVPAPGPGAAAYSASKAALTQLARIAALEWGEYQIRVNILHPDAVFDTGIWTDDVLQARAAHYGMSVAQYKCKNILKTEITSHDVAELTAEMCSPIFAKTTGAQIPIDGGNDRVI